MLDGEQMMKNIKYLKDNIIRTPHYKGEDEATTYYSESASSPSALTGKELEDGGNVV
jgi:hypothetical protein